VGIALTFARQRLSLGGKGRVRLAVRLAPFPSCAVSQAAKNFLAIPVIGVMDLSFQESA
jgi:hypothetical protein